MIPNEKDDFEEFDKAWLLFKVVIGLGLLISIITVAIGVVAGWNVLIKII